MTMKIDIKRIAVHLLIAAGIALVLLFGAMFLLEWGTQHNKEIPVPDFYSLTVPEAEALAKEANVRIDVVDSVFVKKIAKGTVYKQNPLPGSKVKKGRRILITINAVSARMVAIPNLVGYSLRQAVANVQSRGLTVGRLIYRSDMTTDYVLGQQRDGMDVAPGTMVESGTTIDLVVGRNSSDYASVVPKLTGMSYTTACDALHSNSLNVGKVLADTAIVSYSDSLRAIVYKQSPSAQYRVAKGTPVAIHLTLTPEKYEKPKKVKTAASGAKNKKKK